jgi:signal peptide peptidase SppA
MDLQIINIAGKVFSLLTMLQTKMWAMEPKALQAMFADVISMDTWPPKDIEIAEPGQQLRIEGKTAVIDISGILMDEVPKAFTWRGIEATSYSRIKEQIVEAVNNESVDSILLRVASPGGVADAGIIETVDTIRAARDQKPVKAVVTDLGASAAYWLVSQADEISIEANSEIGSIGVYTVYSDSSGLYEKFGVQVNVIKSGDLKGMGIPGAAITGDQITAVKEIVDGIAENFIADVAAGRKRDIAEIRELAVGRLWLAKEAVKLGLADRVIRTNSKTVINNLKGSKMEKNKQNGAGDQTKELDVAAEVKKAAEEIRQADQQRLFQLKEAFPDDPGFALEQFAAGHNVTEAKAEYCDVLKKRLADKEKDNGGAPPLTGSGEGSAETIDFNRAAKQLAKEEKITLGKAYKQIAREQPDVYYNYIESIPPVNINTERRKRRTG